MFVIPNSSAMDATAMGGGPGTFVSQIATGQPEQIANLVTQRLKQAEQFLQLIGQARSAAQELHNAWSGQASETAVKKIHDTLDSFEKIAKVIDTSSHMLGVSGTLIKAAQEAYTTVVSAVNPVVQALASNWWTYGAAVALSSAASAGLRAFIEVIQGMLELLGGGQLVQEISMLMQIVQDVEKLIHSGSHGDSVPPSGTYTKPSTGATTPLHDLPQVASATGQQVSNSGGQDPTVSGLLGQNGAAGHTGGTPGTNPQTGAAGPAGTAGPSGSVGANGSSGGQTPGTQIPTTQIPNTQIPTTQLPNGGQPGQTGTDTGFIPVDPSQGSHTGSAPGVPSTPGSTGGTTPAAPATPPGDITVTTTYDGASTTVTMPVGTQTDVVLTDPTNGTRITEHISTGTADHVTAA